MRVPPGDPSALSVREPRTWRTLLKVLAACCVTVSLVVGVGVLVLTRVHAATGSAVLDSLASDARSVTPNGSREIKLEKQSCDGDSGSPIVVRTLAVTGRSTSDAMREFGTVFQDRQWSSTAGKVPDGVSLERGGRFVVLTRDSRNVYVQLTEVSLFC